jgi:serine/threonine protein kinase
MLQTKQVLQGRYQLQQQLGNNAGRQTWLATDIKISPAEPVTVKLLAFSPQMKWDDFKLFEREASVLKQLNHPRIPKYRDYFSLDKQTGAGLCWFGLVQDYMPGCSLQQLLDRGKRFTEIQVRSIATQVLEILTYLHKLNPSVLHRNIKPSNLILGKDKQVYLVDFGAVQNTAAVEGVTFTVVGTSGYAPLEQFWGKAVPPSDLYALGATLIHLLTGISPADLPQHNLRFQFQDQVSINSSLVSWIEALTEPDLELRLRTASQALKALKTGRFIHYSLKTIQPPFDTKFQILKSPKQLIIKMSRQGIWLLKDLIIWLEELILVLIFAASWLWLALLFILLGLWILFNFILILLKINVVNLNFFIRFLLPVLLLNLLKTLLKAGGREFTKLANSIERIEFIIGVNSDIKLDINKFVIQHRYLKYFSFEQQGRTSNNTLQVFTDKGYKKVFILSNLKRYYLGKTSSKAEGQWLVKEIQEWLAEN